MSELRVGIRGVDSLRHELDRTRESLRDTDATIEKLTGRPAIPNRPPFARRGAPLRPIVGEALGRGRGGAGPLFNLAGYNDAGPPPAKRVAGAFGRLGLPIASQRLLAGRRARDEDEEDELSHKPSLQSSVIATPKDTKSRQDAIAEQQSGAGGKVGTGRNRRMFGLLLGTLVKFKEDEKTKEEQAEKRKAVEMKLEVKQREERDRLKRERFQLFSDRRRHQAKLRALEQKMELVEIHSAWESETHSLVNFIRTTAKPHIFFLPNSHIPESQSKLEESKRVLHELIAERRKQLEEELEEIMREDKDEGNEMLGEYGGSENEADNPEIAEIAATDTNDDKNNKSQKVANEESDLDESDMVGVDYEQSFVQESAHDVSAASESMQADVSEEMPHETVEQSMTDKDDRADLESQKTSHADVDKKDLSETSPHKDNTDVQHNDDSRRQKRRDSEREQERRRRDSSRSRRRSEKHGSRERRRDKERRHGRSEHRRDRDDSAGDKRREHQHRTKDSHKRKERKKAREGSDSDRESGDKSKHSVDRDQKSP